MTNAEGIPSPTDQAVPDPGEARLIRDGRSTAMVPKGQSSSLVAVDPPTDGNVVREHEMGHDSRVSGTKVADIPTASVTDLDLSESNDREEWERRAMDAAERRLHQARERLAAMGVIDERGELTSDELPTDMLPESETTLETG